MSDKKPLAPEPAKPRRSTRPNHWNEWLAAHSLIIVLALAILGIVIAILVLLADPDWKVRCKNAPILVYPTPAPTPVPTIVCPPYVATHAWAYQNTSTCVDTWRVGVYLNVSDPNKQYANETGLQAFFDALEDWMLHNFVPYYQRTVKVTIFTPGNVPIADDWTPYIIHYINDVNMVNVGSCGWHWVHSPGLSNYFQLGNMHRIIGPWAPVPPPGWPVISTPIGVPESYFYDGAWNCITDAEVNGFNATLFDVLTYDITHEYMEVLKNWDSVQYIVTQTPPTKFLNSTQFFITENADPVQWSIPPRTCTASYCYLLANFVKPAYFGGCLDRHCAPVTGSLDYMNTLSYSFVPRNGLQNFLSWRKDTCTMEFCVIVQYDVSNGGNPFMFCEDLGPYSSPVPAISPEMMGMHRPMLAPPSSKRLGRMDEMMRKVRT